MDALSLDQVHMSCLLCGGCFLYPGPRYPVHLFTCHGVVEDGHRDYLVRASEYQMKHGHLPQVELVEAGVSIWQYKEIIIDRQTAICSTAFSVKYLLLIPGNGEQQRRE